ncbi:hypothetical protein BJX96DRAFT_178834 [Aspergillus floccosus]
MSSNEKRAFWRKKCRQALADHIKERVGVVIPPDKVRLQPSREDPYNWVVTDSVKDLFQSNLSSSSVGVFQQICTALDCGDMIEAIPRERVHPGKSNNTDEHCSASSFTATIRKLGREKEELQLAYTQYQQQKEQELLESQKKWSEDTEKLRYELEQWKTQAEARSIDLHDAKELVASVVVNIERQLSHLRKALGIEVPYAPTSPSWST